MTRRLFVQGFDELGGLDVAFAQSSFKSLSDREGSFAGAFRSAPTFVVYWMFRGRQRAGYDATGGPSPATKVNPKRGNADR
jgi:hypothetical protein